MILHLCLIKEIPREYRQQIDLMRFMGLKQIRAFFKGDKLPLPEEPLTMKGVYALVRHLLYLFTLMFLWFHPVMTASGLGLVLGATLYFVLGSLLEEKKMVQQFGEGYRNYQKRVPWMIPFLKWPVSDFYSRRKIK